MIWSINDAKIETMLHYFTTICHMAYTWKLLEMCIFMYMCTKLCAQTDTELIYSESIYKELKPTKSLFLSRSVILMRLVFSSVYI